jgi:hypothetical protein
MLSFGANVKIVSSGVNVIIWCYHVMLSAGMITHPFFIFPENFTHSDRHGRRPAMKIYHVPDPPSVLIVFNTFKG